jgi:hypothetical protein
MVRLQAMSILTAALICASPALAVSPEGTPRGPQSPDGSVLPGHPDVIGEYVRVPGAQPAGTPEALNAANFLRVRRRTPGLHASKAEAVVIAQPGFSGTPGTWLEFAAQLVEKAGARACGEDGGEPQSCNVEVWIMDRRGSNLEDTVGLREARIAGDPAVGLDYYYGPFILTPKGTVPLAPPDDLLGLPGATFAPLEQDDVPFMSEWGFETAAQDIEALIDLLDPQGEGRKNVFIAGHSQGGGYVSYFAGRRFDASRRGHEVAAGLIFLDGGPSIGGSPAPDQADIDAYLAEVDDIRTGASPRFGASLGGITLGTGLGVQAGVVGLYNEMTPGAESIFPPAVQPAHPASTCFVLGFHLPDLFCGGVGLRLTYRASAGINFDDDPVPGAFLQTPVITVLGHRSGHLDFTPLPGTEGTCVAPGPFGFVPPCPRSPAQIDPSAVYDWLDGGGNGPAGPDGPLNGWTTFDNGASFSSAFLNPLPNPSKVASFMNNGFAPARTNVEPFELDFPVSGTRTIDHRELNGFTWYQSSRYDLDSGFVGGFQMIQLDQDGVTYDVDKTAIAAPIYAAARGFPSNPFPLVDDSTVIGSFGTTQSPTAAGLSPIPPATNSAHYGHVDFITADDSLSGAVPPGVPGSSLVGETLIDWILARKQGRTHTPNPNALGVLKTR